MYQLASPKSFIVAGTKPVRTMVASKRTATAVSNPNCWKAAKSPVANPANTAR